MGLTEEPAFVVFSVRAANHVGMLKLVVFVSSSAEHLDFGHLTLAKVDGDER
jgi:hypothetical protein